MTSINHKIVFMTLLMVVSIAQAEPASCSYTTYSWNTIERKANSYQTINKPYADLLPEEKDASSGCTVCREDQQEIQLSGMKPFMVCAKLAADIRAGLEKAIQQGQLVTDVVGYRVGKTKGDVDAKGNRTQFSNHSFGVAIDVNTDHNGLYDNCFTFNDSCRLIKGGAWSATRPESIKPDSPIVGIMKTYGFNWGGKIQGKQKDMMHFSKTGY